jgi:hypothetical protein
MRLKLMSLSNSWTKNWNTRRGKWVKQRMRAVRMKPCRRLPKEMRRGKSSDSLLNREGAKRVDLGWRWMLRGRAAARYPTTARAYIGNRLRSLAFARRKRRVLRSGIQCQKCISDRLPLKCLLSKLHFSHKTLPHLKSPFPLPLQIKWCSITLIARACLLTVSK